MRRSRKVLLAVLGCLVVALVLVAGSAGARTPAAIQTTGYHWVQPWSLSPPTGTWAQPPSWITARW